MTMFRKLLLNSVIGLASLALSYAVFYFYVVEYFYNIIRFTQFTAIFSIAAGSVFIYVIILSVIERSIRKLSIDIAVLTYLLMIIFFSLLREIHIEHININPANLIEDFNRYRSHTTVLLAANLFVYLPIGIYAKYRTRARTLLLTLLFVLYIAVIETSQYLLKRGVFDINDIISNTLGFVLGVALFHVVSTRLKE